MPWLLLLGGIAFLALSSSGKPTIRPPPLTPITPLPYSNTITLWDGDMGTTSLAIGGAVSVFPPDGMVLAVATSSDQTILRKTEVLTVNGAFSFRALAPGSVVITATWQEASGVGHQGHFAVQVE